MAAELGTCGQITIRKKAVGGDDDFSFSVTSGNLTPPSFKLSDGDTQTFSAVPPGTYPIAELAAPAGWQLTDLTCATTGGDTTASVNEGAAKATITMGRAGTVDCTFTNSRLPRLTVVKKVINAYGGTLTASDFPLLVDGAGVKSGVPVTLAAGTHTVSEGALPGGYVQVGITGDCDATGKVTLAAGSDKTCVITNRDVAPQLTVIKHVVNGVGSTKTAAQFTMQVTATSVSTPSFPGSESGTTVTLAAGAYGVDEIAVAGYTKSLSADCTGSIALGQARTCTVTHRDLAGVGYSLTGIKVVGNGNTMRNANVNDVMLNGIDVEGDRNVIEASVVVRSSIGDGIQLVGNGNTISDNTAGGASAGNGGHGISVSGQGNAVRRNAAYDNKGHGIDVSGGTAAWPNAVKANVAGAPGLGNFGNGITVTGRGNDGSAPVEIASNTAQNNYQNGFKVTGTAEQLRGNDAANNALCGYKVASGNLNGTGNLSGHVPIAGADGSAFPIGCR